VVPLFLGLYSAIAGIAVIIFGLGKEVFSWWGLWEPPA
jgi:hypothetical protein